MIFITTIYYKIYCFLLLSFWFLSLITTFLFLINAHFPSFLASFTFWTSFLNSSWSYGMRSSFINIPEPFKLDFLLIMLYFCSVELTLTRIILLYSQLISPTCLLQWDQQFKFITYYEVLSWQWLTYHLLPHLLNQNLWGLKLFFMLKV